ncbi:MAG: hypothetical protein QXO27_03275 [Candidatus Aenigmatarchaeota archaeon]
MVLEQIQQFIMGMGGLFAGIFCLFILSSMMKKNKVSLLTPFLQPEKFIFDIKLLILALICGVLSVLFYTIFYIYNDRFLMLVTSGIPGLIGVIAGFYAICRWAWRFRI